MREHRITLVLYVALFTAMLGAGIIAPVMPVYAETLGATGFWLGFIWAGFSVSRAVFMPVAGRLSDRQGRKRFIVLGLSIYTLSSLGYAWAGGIAHLVIVRFLHGTGSAMVIPIAAAIIGDLSPPGKEGRMMGGFGFALFLGFGAGPLLGGMLLDKTGMAAPFYLMGVLSFVSLLLVMVFLPDQRRQADRLQEVSSFRVLWQSNRFRGLLVFRFSNAVCRATLLSFLPVFAAGLDIGSSRVGILLSVNIVLTGILQQVSGAVADRLQRHVLVAAGNGITATALLLLPLTGTFTHLLLLGILMGVGSGFAFPAAGAVATQLGRHHGMGSLMGYFNMSMSLGMIAGPIVAGLILDRFGTGSVFLFAAAAGFLGSFRSYQLLR
ncbi:MFS transporter [bacterium]|nr:MFS transporter [bacterium]